jgi:hypothetical protein
VPVCHLSILSCLNHHQSCPSVSAIEMGMVRTRLLGHEVSVMTGEGPKPLLNVDGYSKADEERPLHVYAVLAVVYNALFGELLLLMRRRCELDDLARQATLGSIPLPGVATHELSRLIAKDWVRSPIRAPFTTCDGPANASEVNESPRGHGLRLALGELLT